MDKSIFSKDYEVFLECLRRARVKAGLTQVQVAERIKQTQSFVSKCERGERRLDLVEVRAICEAIGLSFVDFVKDFDRRVGAGEDRGEQ